LVGDGGDAGGSRGRLGGERRRREMDGRAAVGGVGAAWWGTAATRDGWQSGGGWSWRGLVGNIGGAGWTDEQRRRGMDDRAVGDARARRRPDDGGWHGAGGVEGRLGPEEAETWRLGQEAWRES
jgi:hypothetical protein